MVLENTYKFGPQDVSRDASPTFAGLTLDSFNGILTGTAGVVSAITDDSSNWNDAYNHSIVDSGNPHNVTPAELNLVIGDDVQAYHATLATIIAGTWTGADSITTLGTIETGIWEATDVGIAHGGTGQSTAQAAIDALSAVSEATDEHVLTKDTASGNAIWKAAAGGVILKSSANKIISSINMTIGGSAFVAKINGNPTATSVVYDTETNEQSIAFLSYSAKIGKLVLHNLTRGNSRLCTNVVIATNTITTESSSDDWADGDDITAESQTAVWATKNLYDLDLSDYLPENATGIIMDVGFRDSADAEGTACFHPYETYANQKILSIRNVVANILASKTIILPIVEQKMVFNVTTKNNGDTGRLSIIPVGYFI